MTLIQGILLGMVQGFTEFLPVSSSGHLTLASAIMELPSDILFTIVVHLGTLASVIIAFRQDVLKLIKGAISLAFDGFKTRDLPSRRLVVLLFAATLPLAIGAVIESLVESMFESTLFVGCALLVTSPSFIRPTGTAAGSRRPPTPAFPTLYGLDLPSCVPYSPAFPARAAPYAPGCLPAFPATLPSGSPFFCQYLPWPAPLYSNFPTFSKPE